VANVLKTDKELAVVRNLVNGAGIRATERVTGVNRDTVMRVLVRIGDGCRDLLDAEMRNLSLRHLQCDEIWTFVGKKQARLDVDKKRFIRDQGDIYLWVAFDEETKLIPTFILGKRTADMARRFMVDLASRVNLPRPTDTGVRSVPFLPQISTDGFPGYPEAVDLAFADNCLYGMCIKDFRNVDQPGRYAPPEIVGMERRQVFGNFDPMTISTSLVERNNLTIRTFMRRFVRLGLGFSKKLENLAAACALHVAYFNFCWEIREPGKSGKYRPAPAVAAGVIREKWSVEDLYHTVR
jgi:IS1 family transposase